MQINGLQHWLYYASSLAAVLALPLGPISLITGPAFGAYVYQGQRLVMVVAYLFLATNLTCLLFWLTSSVGDATKRWLPYLVAELLPLEEVLHRNYNCEVVQRGTQDQATRRLFIYLATINPIESFLWVVCRTSDNFTLTAQQLFFKDAHQGRQQHQQYAPSLAATFATMLLWSLATTLLAVYHDSGPNRRLLKLPLYG